MSVQFILDYFGVDCVEAIEVKASEADVILQRQRIFEQLRNPSSQVYRVRLTSQTLYECFADLENEATVLPTVKLVPRLLLAEKLNATLPDWLTNENIVALDLLKNAAFEISSSDFEKNLLAYCHPDLIFGQNFEKFIQAMCSQTTAFLQLLEQKTIQNVLLNHLEFDVNIARETAELLLQTLKSCDLATFSSTFAYQQHLYFLRQFVTRHALELALPPLELPPALLSLPRLNLPEKEAGALPEKIAATLQHLKTKILATQVPASVLAELLIVDWEIVWSELEELINANSMFLTDALSQKIATFESHQATRLAKKFAQNTYPILAENASVSEVLIWCEGYFNYLRGAFLYQQRLDETINDSFSQYLLAQSARLSLSPANWQHASQKIGQFLEAGYLVIVIMVDALSALNQDLLLAELESFSQQEQLILDSQMLFAPLPTITEIGKKAVLTGKNSTQFSGDYEKALRETYQTFLPQAASLKVINSYKESSEHIEALTNLLVYFENRLDERLHDCVSFEKHREDVKLICSQIKTSIRRWTKDANSLGRDVVFFITADHGMTVTQENYLGESLGEVSERFFKLKSLDTTLPPDFLLFENYAVAKRRLRLTPNAFLTHGGLTPEEVLIPFVTLTTKTPEPTKTSINVTLKNLQARLISPKNWQIDLCLTANKTVSDIRIEANGIFQGKENVDSLRANKTQELVFRFSTSNEQEGRTEMELTIFYSDHVGNVQANEKILKTLAIDFPVILLEKDFGVQSFEDMF